MKAIVEVADGTHSKVKVNSSYSRAGVHYYNLTLNKLKTFLEFEPGITKLYTGDEIKKLTYTMS